ncbi:MAG TPA: pyridoxal-phosphate dependent enzyme, partial [Aggregatilineales bacterium]|nr:pyridoxal-phosphate dependent enzyme [Aggregatilineales bacterium]
SISAGLPRDRVKAMRAVTETGGIYLTVSDEEILAAIPKLAQATGVFAEPAAAATYAGLLKAAGEGVFAPDEEVVALITGNGLKDVAAAQKAVRQAPKVSPDLAEASPVINGIFGS